MKQKRTENNYTPFEDVLKDVLKWFKAMKTEFLIIGGIAASLLGRPRTTQDIDILCLLNQEQWTHFLKIGSRYGFVPRIKDALAFARQNRVLLMRHTKDNISIDISFGVLPFEEESIKRGRFFKLEDIQLPLPTPEDLIIMKAVAHRFGDLNDIKNILEAHPKIDLKRIRRFLKEFTNVLDSPEILQDFNNIVKKVKKNK